MEQNFRQEFRCNIFVNKLVAVKASVLMSFSFKALSICISSNVISEKVFSANSVIAVLFKWNCAKCFSLSPSCWFTLSKICFKLQFSLPRIIFSLHLHGFRDLSFEHSHHRCPKQHINRRNKSKHKS